jgi:putative syringomycin transport system ATP-binding/permease protein
MTDSVIESQAPAASSRRKSGVASAHWSALLRLMWANHPKLTIAMTLTGVLGGFASVAMIETINQSIHTLEDRSHFLIAFVGLSTATILLISCTSALPAYAGLRIITALRVALCRKILSVPLEEIEKRGPANLLTLLTLDIPRLAQTVAILPTILVETTVLMFGLAYIAYLSWAGFALTIFSILVGLPLVLFVFHKGMDDIRNARDEFTTFNGHSHGLVFGAKELRLNSGLRRWFKRASDALSAKKVATL